MRSAAQALPRSWMRVALATDTTPRWATDGAGGVVSAVTAPAGSFTGTPTKPTRCVIRSIMVASLPASVVDFQIVDKDGNAWPAASPFRFTLQTNVSSQRFIGPLALEVPGPFGIAPVAADANAVVQIEFEVLG